MTATTVGATEVGSASVRAVRDVGFPIVASLILLYALVWRMPEAFDRATQRIVDVLKEARDDQRGILSEIRKTLQVLDDRIRTLPR